MAATARSGNPALRNAKKVADAKANAKAMNNVFDLDELSKEDVGLVERPPFVAKLKGVVFTASDPGDLDFTQLTGVQNSAEGMRAFFQRVINDDALFEKIMDPTTGPVEQWKLFALMEKWTEHYDYRLRHQGEGDASPQP